MEQSFVLTILSFFAAMLASGLLAEFIKRKLSKGYVVPIGVLSFITGIGFVKPTRVEHGLNQVFYFTLLIFFINFAMMLFFPRGKA